MPNKQSRGARQPACALDCEVCKHLGLAFEAMLEYHAVTRARYEEALGNSNTAEASALEMELASSAEPIRRAVKEIRDHEATHSREEIKTRHRLLRLVKAIRPKYGTSFLLDKIETE